MNNKTNLLAVIVLAFALLVLSFSVMGGRAVAAPEVAPQNAGYISTQLLTARGVTRTVTGTVQNIAAFSLMDCYNFVDVTNPQTVTVKLWHSYDQQNWFSLTDYPAVSADASSFTHTILYGAYVRASADVVSTNSVTITLKCVMRE